MNSRYNVTKADCHRHEGLKVAVIFFVCFAAFFLILIACGYFSPRNSFASGRSDDRRDAEEKHRKILEGKNVPVVPARSRGSDVKRISSAEVDSRKLLPEHTPIPRYGYAEGVIVCMKCDLKESESHRSAFKYTARNKIFPLVECAYLELLEDRLSTYGEKGQHGGVVVHVRGEALKYRGRNYLRLTGFKKLESGGFPNRGFDHGVGAATAPKGQ